MKPRILFFTPERPASAGLLHAQVMTPARTLLQNGFECLFLGAETTPAQAEQTTRRIAELYGLRAHLCPGFSARFGVLSIHQTARTVARRARLIIHDFHPTHVYAWTFVAGRVARRIAQREHAAYVYDIKGIRHEEIALTRGHNWRSRLCRAVELHEIRRADRLGCVSEKLKQWVQQQTGRGDAVVIPSCIDADRFTFDIEARRRIRQEFGLAETTPLVGYCGGLGWWQRIDDILRLFREVAELRPTFGFLLLTTEPEALRHKARAGGLPLERCVITSSPHDQVPGYLSACDAGIILRHNNVVNNTASPIKIGEYLGCGLPVILTRGIGDFGEQIARAGIGLMLEESGNTAQQVVNFLESVGDVRRQAVEFCHRHLVFGAYVDQYRQLFSTNP